MRRGRRALLLVAAGACAACALVYELALVALGGVLIGSSITQTSLVISLFVFALGLGALAAKPLLGRPLPAFVVVETGVAVVGGFSVLACYAAFAYTGVYTPAVVVVSLLCGALVGAELPLLMELLQRIRRQAAARAMADLTAADYVGALLGGLSFPFVLLPLLGQLRGALAAGLVNLACAALIVLVVFGPSLTRRARAGAVAVLAAGTIAVGGGLAYADRFEVSARQQLYDDPIVLSERTPYQEIDITESLTLGGAKDVRLFLNGDLQLSSRDEYRYHESLVHPALGAWSAAHADAAGPRRVLVLGGGDGMAVREVLRRPGVAHVRLVDLDPEMTRLAREDPRLREMNRGSLRDRRVTVTNADAFGWVRRLSGPDARSYDVVIVDFPDPDDLGLARLYTAEIYGMIRTRALAPGGVMAVQSGSPYFAPDAFWSVGATLRLAGWRGRPYHVDVPTFGDWGFWLATPAAAGRGAPPLTLAGAPRDLRFLSADVLRAAAAFPPDRGPREVRATTLDRPAILDYTRRGWSDY
jgi:spermidine synthase